MKICFCNFDFDGWRLDLAAKLSVELTEKEHECYYYNYKRNTVPVFSELETPIEVIPFPRYKKKSYKLGEYKKYTQEELEDISYYNTQVNLVTRRPKKNNRILRKKVKIFLEKIRRINEQNPMDLFLIWGGNRFNERALVAYAKKHEKTFLILEMGYFRPFTLTVESKGLNDHNSLPRDAAFYRSRHSENGMTFDEIFKPTSSYLDDSQISRIGQLLPGTVHTSSGPRNTVSTSAVPVDLKGRYLFAPFQVETDAQIILHSPQIKKMRNFVAVICEAVEEYNLIHDEPLKVIFKPHPVDKKLNVSSIEKALTVYPFAVMSHLETTQELIDKAQLVVTINSTVGIESLIAQKPVVTLGNAFYNLPELVTNCTDYDSLHLRIEEALSRKVDSEFLLDYLRYLRTEYFHEVFFEGADPESVKTLTQRILDDASRQR